MAKFIQLILTSYPRFEYSGGESNVKYHKEIINIDTISRIRRKTDLLETNTEILLIGEKGWLYCNNTYEELYKLIEE